MSFPAGVHLWTTGNQFILAQDVRKGTVLSNPDDGHAATVACVVVSHASKPYVGALTPQQGCVIARRARRLLSLSHRLSYDMCPYIGADIGGADVQYSPDIRFDFLIADRYAAVVANGVYAIAWDPTFVLNAKVQLLPGFAEGAVFYE